MGGIMAGMRRWMAWLVLAVMAAVGVTMLQTLRTPSQPDRLADEVANLNPNPGLKPDEVVRIQLAAFRANHGDHNDGIAAAFRFASPANRAQIGSLEQFVRIVHSPAYLPMINHVEAVIDHVQVEGDRAQQMVVLTGPDREVAMYVFLLSRQQGGDYDGCWMTDGVMRVEGGPPLNPMDEQVPTPQREPRPMRGHDLPV